MSFRQPYRNHDQTNALSPSCDKIALPCRDGETQALSQVAGDLKITIVIGINERGDSGPGNGTVYKTLPTFTPDGKQGN